MSQIIATVISILLLVGCNGHDPAQWEGANVVSDNHVVLYNISGNENEVLLNEDGPVTLTITPKWATILVVEDSFELESSKLFSAWEISPGKEGELYSLIRSYWELSQDWTPNLDPASLKQVGDLDILLEALICSGGGDSQPDLEDYLDITCPDAFIPQSLFREIATGETSFSLDYPGKRVIFVFY